jgi:hypothetical protein
LIEKTSLDHLEHEAGFRLVVHFLSFLGPDKKPQEGNINAADLRRASTWWIDGYRAECEP